MIDSFYLSHSVSFPLTRLLALTHYSVNFFVVESILLVSSSIENMVIRLHRLIVSGCSHRIASHTHRPNFSCSFCTHSLHFFFNSIITCSNRDLAPARMLSHTHLKTLYRMYSFADMMTLIQVTEFSLLLWIFPFVCSVCSFCSFFAIAYEVFAHEFFM